VCRAAGCDGSAPLYVDEQVRLRIQKAVGVANGMHGDVKLGLRAAVRCRRCYDSHMT
jgi:hypothetical protein